MEKIKCESCDEIYDPSLPHYCAGFDENTEKERIEKRIKKLEKETGKNTGGENLEDIMKRLEMENKENVQQYTGKKDWFSIASICLGVVSIIFWEFSIIPILAIIFGAAGLFNGSEKKLKSGIGIVLGVVFLLVRIAHGSN